MNTPINNTNNTTRSPLHPMMIAAAIAVILFCLAGTAAIMGWIPTSTGSGSASGELTPADRAALASRMADTDSPGTLNAPAGANSLVAINNDAERNRAVQRERERDLAVQRERDRERDLAAAAERRDAPVRVAQNTPARPSNWCGNCGNVESVRTIRQRAQGSGLGAAGGAVLGGLLGNQIGGGSGRKIATVAGAVGGAVVGNQVEGNMKATTTYEVRVRLDDGKTRTFNLQNLNGFSTGDRIKVVNGSLRHAG